MHENIARAALEEHRDFEGATHLVDVPGLSSPRVCRFLNELVRRMDPHEKYLEIGTFKGRTLISAAFGNRDRTCVGCDKFRFYGRFTGLGWAAKAALRRNVERHRAKTGRIELHDVTSQRFFAERRVEGPIGVYFYDGDHGFEGTKHGIVAAAPLLSDRAVIVVDDWNDETIRDATHAGLAAARLEVAWWRELEGDHGERGWWNGLGVFFVARRGTIARAA